MRIFSSTLLKCSYYFTKVLLCVCMWLNGGEIDSTSTK